MKVKGGAKGREELQSLSARQDLVCKALGYPKGPMEISSSYYYGMAGAVL